MDRKQRGQMTTGIMLVTIGVLFLLDESRSGLWFRHLWPVILIVLGASKLLFADGDPARGRGRSGGAWLLFVGALFLLHNYQVMRIQQSWPLFIVAGGISIMFGSSRRALGAARIDADGGTAMDQGAGSGRSDPDHERQP